MAFWLLRYDKNDNDTIAFIYALVHYLWQSTFYVLSTFHNGLFLPNWHIKLYVDRIFEFYFNHSFSFDEKYQPLWIVKCIWIDCIWMKMIWSVNGIRFVSLKNSILADNDTQIDIMKACFGFSVCQLVANYFWTVDQLTLIRFETVVGSVFFFLYFFCVHLLH